MSVATKFVNGANALNNKITNLADGTADGDAVNKGQLDAKDPNAHSTTHTDGTDDIQDATALVKGLMTSTQAGKLDGIEESANDYSHPNHSGDVTSVGDGAQTIAARAVDFAQMQAIDTDRILGRDTAGSGDIEELTPTDVRTLINVEDGSNNYSLEEHGDSAHSEDYAKKSNVIYHNYHGGDANAARNNDYAINQWMGWVEPVNATDLDTWIYIPEAT